MLSIIQSAIRDQSEYDTIFLHSYNTPMDVELIIIDSLWSEERKKKIKQIPNGFKQVVYAPAKKQERKLPYDFLSAHNTGLAYSEGEFCMPMGGRNELHPMFYEHLRGTIDNLGYGVAIRPIELEANNGDKKWDTYVKYPQRYFFLPTLPLGSNGLRSMMGIQTCGFLIMNREYWYSLNGLDERYDIGCKWWDNEFLDRLYLANIDVAVDQKLMIYRYPHMSAQPPERDAECKKIYDDNKGNLYAPNPFSLRTLHEELIKKKQEYIL